MYKFISFLYIFVISFSAISKENYQANIYSVKSGDSLVKIIKKFYYNEVKDNPDRLLEIIDMLKEKNPHIRNWKKLRIDDKINLGLKYVIYQISYNYSLGITRRASVIDPDIEITQDSFTSAIGTNFKYKDTFGLYANILLDKVSKVDYSEESIDFSLSPSYSFNVGSYWSAFNPQLWPYAEIEFDNYMTIGYDLDPKSSSVDVGKINIRSYMAAIGLLLNFEMFNKRSMLWGEFAQSMIGAYSYESSNYSEDISSTKFLIGLRQFLNKHLWLEGEYARYLYEIEDEYTTDAIVFKVGLEL